MRETNDLQSTAVLLAKALSDSVSSVIAREIDELEEARSALKGESENSDEADTAYLDGAISALQQIWDEISRKFNVLGIET